MRSSLRPPLLRLDDLDDRSRGASAALHPIRALRSSSDLDAPGGDLAPNFRRGTLKAMAMNMTEKILARASGRESVKPGDLLLARVDFAMGHDLTIPPASKIMREQMGATKVWDSERLAVVQDHFQPAKDTASAALGKTTRDWAREMGIKWYFEVG